VLIITFDESNASDPRHGGGRIAMLVIGPKVKRGFRSTRFYQNQSALRLIAESLRLPSLPGASANAPSMAEFFNGGGCGVGAPSPSVSICTPASDGSTLNDPVQFAAVATSSVPVTTMQIYDNGNLIWQKAGNSINTSISLQPGGHTLAAKAWTSKGTSFLSLRKVNVR
jgi:acid phosphatase